MTDYSMLFNAQAEYTPNVIVDRANDLGNHSSVNRSLDGDDDPVDTTNILKGFVDPV
jgi:hypothetical protein